MSQREFNDTAPGVIDLRLQDVKDAALVGIVSEQQALDLWRWLDQRDHQRSSAPGAAASAPVHATGLQFGFVNVLYYFGGMVAISAMTLFMTLGWESFGPGGLLAISLAYGFACLKMADHFKARSLPVPAGILATLAVCLVPQAW